MSTTTDHAPAPVPAEQVGASILQVTRLGKRFGRKTVLTDVSLSVSRGEVVGLVGQNGAGKSTLLSICAGLSRATSGQVNREGAVALLPERVAFVEHVRGITNLRLLGRLRAHPSEQRLSDLMTQVGLDPRLRTSVGRYSQGMRQRLGMAQALMESADLLILDEPSNGLDPDGMRWLRGQIRAEAERGAGVLVSSHLLDELERTCDRVVLIREGTTSHEWTPGGAAAEALVVEVDDPAVLTEACARRAWSCVAGDGQFVVQAPLASGEVVRQLAADGVDFRSLMPQRRSLESALMGGPR